ncbi:hypothetical protein GH741_06285 [Aquibacillus halophilus]|uniref:Swarming motility protein SwrB n=1 Tax=Aquibacillus halophilus TaxID=930132 RepID=A0A6A8DHB1_9BACI|nr:hypothetical protein [Aquibacillus halophilus]MRH42287.1 hypothetical protein [Aquibacillus halophilus]
MVYLLLLISFLLHIIFFIILKSFNDRIKQSVELESMQKQHTKEIEDLLSVYLLEIKEENDSLLNAINNQEYPEDVELTKPSKIASIKGKNTASTMTGEKTTIRQLYQSKQVDETSLYTPPSIDEVQDTVEQTISGKVYTLYSQGDSIETIARKLDCGKTEIELMLKFHRKNS